MLSPAKYWAVLLAVTAYAFLCGRKDERAAAIVCVAASLGTLLLHSQLSQRFAHVEYGLMTVDALAFIGFAAIALRTDRFWPLWVAGLQLTTILSHILKAVELDLLPQAYAAAARLWVYPIFGVIVLGTWRTHHRQLREFESTPT